MDKDFNAWNTVKQRVQTHQPPLFSEGQVWWCSIGVNVGDEQDGKGASFMRPVLVLRKFNRNVFIGVPLSTKQKDNRFYSKIVFNDVEQSVLLSQIRLMDARRFGKIMGKLTSDEVKRIKAEIQQLIF
jgi:mRNA interferase MazF